jgi:xylulokinase
MDKYFLGIDIGTSGCKSCVIDNKGKLIASACHEYSPLITRERWVEQDPINWYRALD